MERKGKESVNFVYKPPINVMCVFRHKKFKERSPRPSQGHVKIKVFVLVQEATVLHRTAASAVRVSVVAIAKLWAKRSEGHR